jgi:hypothetical protein
MNFWKTKRFYLVVDSHFDVHVILFIFLALQDSSNPHTFVSRFGVQRQKAK